MPKIEAGKRYPATVYTACLMESTKGTPGINITFEIDGVGQIEHTIWLTPKTIERAKKDLCLLGAKAEDLKSWAYLENIGGVICGGACDITTFEDEYNGEKRVRVQWINERRQGKQSDAAGNKLSSRVAALFGGDSPPPAVTKPVPPANAPAIAAGITDEDVPF